MLTHSKALWRIEYKTDLTRANSVELPVAYMLEARWSDGIRWLGMYFRKRFTEMELRYVNTETWPEMKDQLTPFVISLFEEAWKNCPVLSSSLEPSLGSNRVALKFSDRS